jgi:hypothetical protein
MQEVNTSAVAIVFSLFWAKVDERRPGEEHEELVEGD